MTVAPERGIGLSLGAAEVLTKPVDRARLTALINRLVCRDGPVLVVEDDADTRDMMRQPSKEWAFRWGDRQRSLGAVLAPEHSKPAMVLLDLMMPEMDGFAFLDAVAAVPNGATSRSS